MSNYAGIQKELLSMREDLLNTDTLGRKFFKFEKKFDKLFEIVSFQLLNDPDDKFYGNWLINANRIKCYSITTALSHQVSNTKVNLLINPLIFCKYSNEEVKLLMKHEVIHLVSEHHRRVNELNNTYLRAIPLLAADLVANHILEKETNKPLPSMFWTPLRMKEIFDIDIELDNDTTIEGLSKVLNEFYYENSLFGEFITSNSAGKMEEFLRDMNSELDSMGASGSLGESNAEFDADLMRSIMTNILQSYDSDTLLIGDMLKHITVDAAIQSRGRFPSGLMGLIKTAMEPPVVTWEEQLRRFIGSIAAGKKPSLFRRNRRQPFRVDLKGELRDKEIDLIVAIDTSGSMDDRIISKCMNEIFELTKLMKAEITIIECDSRVQKVYKADKPSDVQPEVIGRGGTEFSPVFRWIKENKKNDSVLIFMTDGYGENKIDCKVKHQGTLWLLTERKECLSLKGSNLPARSKVLSFTNK